MDKKPTYLRRRKRTRVGAPKIEPASKPVLRESKPRRSRSRTPPPLGRAFPKPKHDITTQLLNMSSGSEDENENTKMNEDTKLELSPSSPEQPKVDTTNEVKTKKPKRPRPTETVCVLRWISKVPQSQKFPKVIELRKDDVSVGRIADQVDFCLDSTRTPRMISRVHAKLIRDRSGSSIGDVGQKWFAVDNKSVNGVYVNGKRIGRPRGTGRMLLQVGDQVRFGKDYPPSEFVFVFEETQPEASEATKTRKARHNVSVNEEERIRREKELADANLKRELDKQKLQLKEEMELRIAKEKAEMEKKMVKEKKKLHYEALQRQLADKASQEMAKKLADEEAQKLRKEVEKIEREKKHLEEQRKKSIEKEKENEEQKKNFKELQEKLNKQDEEAKNALKRTESMGQKIEEELICVICQDVIVKTMSLKCGHVACHMCLDQWLSNNPTCPVCREPHEGDPFPLKVLDNTIDLMVKTLLNEDERKDREERLKEWKEWDTKKKEAKKNANAPQSVFSGYSGFSSAFVSSVGSVFGSGSSMDNSGSSANNSGSSFNVASGGSLGIGSNFGRGSNFGSGSPFGGGFGFGGFGAPYSSGGFGAPYSSGGFEAGSSSSVPSSSPFVPVPSHLQRPVVSRPPARRVKPMCVYGAGCYRRSADHREGFAHPDDSSEDSEDLDGDEESDRYSAEHATNGYGTCLDCGDGIMMHLLQITDTRNHESYHVRCFSRDRRQQYKPEQMQGFDRLRADKKAEFKRLWNAASIDSS